MPVEIELYPARRVGAVHAFNQRLKANNVSFSLHESPTPFYQNKENRKLYQEYLLAVEGDQVRGGYQLKHQELALRGRIVPAAAYQLPVSEGAIDRRYAAIGLRLIRDALQRTQRLYALGMGGSQAQLARLLQGMGWKLRPIPLYVRVVHPFRFLRNVRALRKTLAHRLLLEGAAFSGLGWAGAKVASTWVARHKAHRPPVNAEEVEKVSDWADELWEACKDRYTMVGVRDSHVLQILYPGEDRRFSIVKVSEGTHVIGWAVVFVNDAADHKHFGNMRIGSMVDCLALPENAGSVIQAATEVLHRKRVDLILTHQSHALWGKALWDAGFVRRPSKFMFGISKQLARDLDGASLCSLHVNRGDGAGGIMDPQLWGDRPVRHLTDEAAKPYSQEETTT